MTTWWGGAHLRTAPGAGAGGPPKTSGEEAGGPHRRLAVGGAAAAAGTPAATEGAIRAADATQAVRRLGREGLAIGDGEARDGQAVALGIRDAERSEGLREGVEQVRVLVTQKREHRALLIGELVLGDRVGVVWVSHSGFPLFAPA